MLGNSFAVPVMRWIGRRIDLVRAIAPDDDAAVPAKASGKKREAEAA
jgi:hypothetical protein